METYERLVRSLKVGNVVLNNGLEHIVLETEIVGFDKYIHKIIPVGKKNCAYTMLTDGTQEVRVVANKRYKVEVSYDIERID